METCRICLESANVSSLISPCGCKGSQKYVHAKCLESWQDTTMNNALSNPSSKLLMGISKCNVCGEDYRNVVKSSNRIYFSPHIRHLWFRYAYQRYGVFAVFVALFAILGWVITSLLVVISLVGLGLYYSVRPSVNKTPSGYRVSLISIGRPVTGLRRGILLKATAQISRGIFKDSKVILTEYTRQKAVGFVINKSVSNLYLALKRKTIRFGGPVQISVIHTLHNNPFAEGCIQVVDGVYYGGRINQTQTEYTIFNVLGHAEWKPLQLDGEVRLGSWDILGMATSSDIFLQ